MPFKRFREQVFLAAGLTLVVAGGLWLRLHNVSPYLFYPDSYQNLSVSENLADYRSTVGRLGPEGMWYPDVLGWARPGYAAAALAVSRLGGLGLREASQTVAVIFGVAALPLAYLVARHFTARRWAAFGAALLLALSYSHVVWGGFVMTETAGVFMTLLYVWWLLRRRPGDDGAGYGWTVIAGLLLAACILVRYEYVLLFVPAVYRLQGQGRAGWRRLGALAATAWLALTVFFLAFPMPFSPVSLWAQLWSLAAAVLLGCLAVVAGPRLWAARPGRLAAKLLRRYGTWTSVAAGVLTLVVVGTVPLGGLWRFLGTDFLLAGCGAGGLGLMLASRRQRRLAIMLLVGLLLLGASYYEVNPEMDRYYTHLLPLLVGPAAITLARAGAFRRRFAGQRHALGTAAIAACLLVTQGWLSYQGLHRRGALWFERSYEEQAALGLRPWLQEGQIIVAAMPEPYHFFTGLSTYGVTDLPPYLTFGPDVPGDRPVVIVEDMALREAYPAVTAVVRERLADRRAGQYDSGGIYRYITTVKPVDGPVVIYVSQLSELRARLAMPAAAE